MTTSTKSVRGLGAAGSGTQHHIRQRVSALALLILVPWFLYSVTSAMGAGYEDALAWMGKTYNAVPLILLISAALYHMRLGMEVVIEDYIGKTGTRQALLILNAFVVLVMFVAATLAVLGVWLGTNV
ncbi:MAG: succinate dehydrogenase, hydrophobic membrane anchor protein [Henriciella sp.]